MKSSNTENPGGPMHSSQPRRVFGRLTILTLMALAFDGHAATTLANTNITLSNFAYQVTDLDAGDGIAASATFDTSATGGGIGMVVADIRNSLVVSGGNVKYVSGTPFTSSSATQTVSGIAASASKSGPSFSTSAAYNLSDLTGLVDAQPAGMENSAVNTRYASINEFPVFITLSAHTSIQFSGTVYGSSLVTADGFLTTASFAKIADAEASVTVTAGSHVSIGLQDVAMVIEPLPSDGPQYVGLDVYMSTVIDPLGNMATFGSNEPFSQAFTLTFTNDSDHSVVKSLVMDLSSNVTVMATPVPEVSNMAMMVLGLTGLVGLARRRPRERR